MNKYTKTPRCRASGSTELIPILSLGCQTLTGVFPKSNTTPVTTGPLELSWCPESGFLQLSHSYSPSELYGDNYGYRSGLNQSMVDHLRNKIRFLEKLGQVELGDVVVDIGSNDCTALKAYSVSGLKRIGIDPTGKKFMEHYPPDISLVPDFFSAEKFHDIANQKAKIITSIAMFYDLEDPNQFAREVASILAGDGLWHFEQSYMPAMLRLNSYDTICHEHLGYYSLAVVKKIVEQAGLRVIDVRMNAINGGSFSVTAAHADNKSWTPNQSLIDWLLEQEQNMSLHTLRPYREFEKRIFRHRDDLTRLIRTLNADGKKVFGYGASTKGNVILQFCGFTKKDIPAIAEVNRDKWGCYTPGTHIPILSEAEIFAMNPDYLLVLPWHFKDNILRREKNFLNSGGHFIFPFPEVEIV